MDPIDDDSLVIEAYVDANGRVQDYRILSDSERWQGCAAGSEEMLIFTTFRPALSMGRPTAEPGSAVVLEDQCERIVSVSVKRQGGTHVPPFSFLYQWRPTARRSR